MLDLWDILDADGSCSLTDNSTSYKIRVRVSTQRVDADLIQQDFKALGFDINIPKPKTTYSEIDGRMVAQTTRTFETKSHLGSLFAALGAMCGSKTNQKSPPVPDFIINGSKLVKREFIAALFSGDGGATTGISSFTRLRMHKVSYYADSMINFLNNVAEILRNNFNITSKVKNDNTTISLQIDVEEENILRFLTDVGYRYCIRKQFDADKVSEYLKYKKPLGNKVASFKDFMSYTNKKMICVYGYQLQLNQYHIQK